MTPIIALIGRPNVGKSTLFNRLTGTRSALVTNSPGLTRDRKYGSIRAAGCELICIDTGGIENSKEGIGVYVTGQSFLAIEEANMVLFIVDARVGPVSEDLEIARYLHSRKKEKLLVANKTDGIDVNQAISNFWSLGFDKIYPISASQGNGIRNLMKSILSFFANANLLLKQKSNKSLQLNQKKLPIKLVIIGRPNVGKSMLTNRLLGENRVIVYDFPGTTRDSIRIPMQKDRRRYILIDTAGIRKRIRITDVIEKISVIKSLQEIEGSDVVLLVIDAKEGIPNQDLSLINLIINSGRSLVIVVNKWDRLSQIEKNRIKEILNNRLNFIDFVRIHFVSALYGDGISSLLASVCEAYDNSIRCIGTSVLTRIMNMAIENHQPPVYNNRRVKLKYAHAGGYNPLIIVIHGNQVKNIPAYYRRYLTNYFRRSLKIMGSLICLRFKEGRNPYIKNDI